MRAVLLMILSLTFCGPLAAAPRSVFIEELSWTELRDAIRTGTTTAIIPVGGTEQSGPHMALGKHNVRVRALAGRIAAALGTALVAPVVAYVPEGAISPPTGHMRFPGTISVPEEAFRSVLEGAGRSLKQSGFLDVVLIGDHGGYQPLLKEVSTRLNRAWAQTPVRAHYVDAYYRAAEIDYPRLLREKGLTDIQIGTHAGVADTSLTMAIDRALVWPDRIPPDPVAALAAGVRGDARASSPALGRIGVELIVAETVAAIRDAQAEKR